MLDKRWSLIISSMVLAGVGAAGCTEEGTTNINGGGSNQVTCESKDDCSKAECKSAEICKEDTSTAITNPEDCTSSTCDQDICKSQEVCKGGSQEQPCTKDDCNQDRCKGQSICQGEAKETFMCKEGTDAAGKTYSYDDEDTDQDGLSNKLEMDAGYNPCQKDKAEEFEGGVTIKPDDPKVIEIRKEACKPRTEAVEPLLAKHFAHAKLNNVTYREFNEGEDNFIAFDADGVSGVFLYSADDLKKGNFLMKQAFSGRNYNPYVTDPVVKIDSGTVPKFEISRVKYQMDSDGTSMADIINSLAKKVLGKDLPASSNSKTCSDQTVIYFAGVKYDNIEGAYYNISVACNGDVEKNANIGAVMDDVISGTLIAPEQTYYPDNERPGCLTRPLGAIAGSVDFIWVIDNSGSMVDELSNLSATVDKFMDKLNASGIQYRIGVTATDAYLLDEWPDYYMADVIEPNGESKSYYEPSGLINGGPLPNKTSKCLMTSDNMNSQALKNKILNRQGCTKDLPSGLPSNFTLPTPSNKNICGFGFEDGLKSGLVALQRLSLASDNPISGLENSEAILSAKNQFARDELEQCGFNKTEENNTLKYILFVSDEESRQFKENDEGKSVARNTATQEEQPIKNLIGTFNYTIENDNFSYNGFYVSKDNDAYDELGEADERKSTRSLIGCRTGYQLDGSGKMLSGKWDFATEFKKKCHVASDNGNGIKTSLLSEKGLAEDTPLEEIQSKYSEYYAMLNYYMEEYRKFGGENGSHITAFALVGDSGRPISENDPRDGSCRKLAACENGCKILDSNGVLQPADGVRYACDDCDEWNTNDSGTMIGADHGLSYIHFAKFLNKDRGGKSASICTDKFENTINAIFEDVQSRVSTKYWLSGYPISSTIHVHMTGKNQVAVEFTRGASTNGWQYDPVENAVILTGIDSSVDTSGYVVFSFIPWDKNSV